MKIEKVDILGTEISAVSLKSSVLAIEEMIARKQTGYICVCPVSSIVKANEDEEFRDILKKSLLATPDGKPVSWYMKSRGFKRVTRVCGRDLMRQIFLISRKKRYKHFFFGGTETTLSKLKNNLLKEFPWLDICGMYAPPFREKGEKENDEVISRIILSKPDIVWVGLGSPKQEKWMACNSYRINGAVSIGVGAVFNFYAGIVKSAPVWIQNIGFEWFFRLLCEPKRLWKRYLYGNTKFIYLVLKEAIKCLSEKKEIHENR